MTPLVDVMLVLLIIFMVTAPLLATGVKVDLPQAKAAKPLDPKAPVVVAVGSDGHIALGADQIDRADLVARVKLKLGDDLSQVIHIRGDKDVAFGQIVSVMDELAQNGLTHLAIVTDSSHKAAGTLRRPARDAIAGSGENERRGDARKSASALAEAGDPGAGLSAHVGVLLLFRATVDHRRLRWNRWRWSWFPRAIPSPTRRRRRR